MVFLFSVFSIFTPYVTPFERRAQKFFTWVNSMRSRDTIEKRLLALMQENLLVLNMWLEKRFKNYRNLRKGARKRVYTYAAAIMTDFDAFEKAHTVTLPDLRAPFDRLGVPFNSDYVPELAYLHAIMVYLNPQGRFHYQEGSAFSKLFVNIAKGERMTGDCNQIVTLYAYMFSRKFDINHLQIKLIPGHVCLHYNGIDIEATAAGFTLYKTYDIISPITELIATNVLDITDPTEVSASIAPETFVKAAQLAYALSHKREIVEHNLQVAYRNLCLAALKQKNFERAYFYAEKEGGRDLLNACYGSEFNVLADKVRGIKLLKDAKDHRETYRKMYALAQKMNDAARVKELAALLKQIG